MLRPSSDVITDVRIIFVGYSSWSVISLIHISSYNTVYFLFEIFIFSR